MLIVNIYDHISYFHTVLHTLYLFVFLFIPHSNLIRRIVYILVSISYTREVRGKMCKQLAKTYR